MNNEFYLIKFDIILNKTVLSGFTIWNNVQVNEFLYLKKLLYRSERKFLKFTYDNKELEVSIESLFSAYKFIKISLDDAVVMSTHFPIVKDSHYGFMVSPLIIENFFLSEGKEDEAPL